MIWSAHPPYLEWLAYMSAAYAIFLISKRFTDSGREIGPARGDFGRELSLWQAVRGYLSHPTALLFALLVAGLWGVRIYVANWTWLDLLVAACLVAAWPLVEWVVHLHILHAKPRRVLGFTYDPLFAQIHRAHHRNPHHPEFGIVPPATLAQYFLLIPGFFFALFIWPRPLTLAAVAATLAFRYELWHYLIHSSYKPRSKWFRRLRDRHWRHHFLHEGYWYGVTTTAGDVLLGTNPDPKAVPISPTVRSLGYEDSRNATEGVPYETTYRDSGRAAAAK